MKIDFKLDCLYQKILLLMSQQLVIYPSAILSTLKSPHPVLELSEIWNIQFILVSYLNTIMTVDAD